MLRGANFIYGMCLQVGDCKKWNKDDSGMQTFSSLVIFSRVCELQKHFEMMKKISNILPANQ
jgi:hypothetical protein